MRENEPFISVIGSANMDIHGSPDHVLRHHDSNPGSVENSPGGVARNIAENLARLGNDCRLIAPLGDDHSGRMLMERGLASGIDMQDILKVDSVPTSTYLSILDENGDLVAAINDMAIMEHLGPRHLQVHLDVLRQADLVIIDTNLKEEALSFIMEHLGDRPIFADTVSCAKAGKIKPHLHAIHTLKPSLAEAEELAGIKVDSPCGLSELADWFHEQGVRRMFVSLGSDGVFYSDGEKQGLETTMEKSTTDIYANGAGDALSAGLAHAWVRRWPLVQSVRFAMSAAHLAILHPGTINPDMSPGAVNRIFETAYA
ncbi:MAG: PfkB family carbohydrate kinase [Gemmatimonadota bacterium]|nr:PfkB family carbohydrate kinase [Gemmatimonadota bacterium]